MSTSPRRIAFAASLAWMSLVRILIAPDRLAAETPHLLADLLPGPSDGVPSFDAAVFDGKLYFAGDLDGGGEDLLVYDGVSPPSLVPGGEGTRPTDLVVFEDALYYQGGPYGGEEDRELWRYDGVGAAAELMDLFPAGSSRPYAFAVFGDQLCFQATMPNVGAELVCWDGVQSSPDVHDLWSGAQSSGVEDLTVLGDTLFFSGFPGPSQGRELGIFQPPTLPAISELVPGNVGSNPGSFTRLGSTVYFVARDPDGSVPRVWSDEGMSMAPVAELDDFEVQGGLTGYQGRLLVVGQSPTSEEARLHAWNGIGLEVVQTTDTAWDAHEFVQVGTDVYFLADSSTTSFDLFRFDGQDVVRVLDGELTGYYLTGELELFDGRLWFSAFQPDSGEELWWIVPPGLIFVDGFESGDVSRWTP